MLRNFCLAWRLRRDGGGSSSRAEVSRSTEEAVSTRDMERKLFTTEFTVLGIQ